jgi:hypothetical protein
MSMSESPTKNPRSILGLSGGEVVGGLDSRLEAAFGSGVAVVEMSSSLVWLTRL